MRRRTFLATGAASVASLSGCLGGLFGSGSSEAKTVRQDGVDVPLAPVDETYEWHQNDAARFADARSLNAYQRSHIAGAVSSPVGGFQGDSGEDPVSSWPKDAKIVCYCGCPHHLSSMRAADLIQNGYEDVSVIDEGFWEWHERGYPIEGEQTEAEPSLWTIEGVTGAAHAGASAWAYHVPSGQREATPIASDGSYILELRFADVTADSEILVRTPAYELTDTLSALASTIVGRE